MLSACRSTWLLLPPQREEFRFAFDAVNTNHASGLDAKQAVYLLNSVGITTGKKDVQALEQEYEEHGSFSFEDLLQISATAFTDSKIKRDLFRAFRALDPNNTGSVKVTELRHILSRLGLAVKLTPEEVEALIQDADPRRTGLCEYAELIELIVSR
uniref:Calmodulin n=1 Tax=Chromera velia CCMP2878 TaxID=1169474 RepID=A0A0G4I2A9_9ALVE|eukprot:Cvel_10283.t1-p1 / transcript=Cvel_10283.t1 / gene=Cvel_10283 / organism=Chromera_velia_CCMP2878 / gene_product=Calmodulin, putative / transcript_product=Calmodulin, putative / location=Cvel_scaffold617:22100-24127(-) / protein_length=155 / sequence_SO=supercontig / SO=protein_coding / is_pseudo=false